jgi:hypothetical protein
LIGVMGFLPPSGSKWLLETELPPGGNRVSAKRIIVVLARIRAGVKAPKGRLSKGNASSLLKPEWALRTGRKLRQGERKKKWNPKRKQDAAARGSFIVMFRRSSAGRFL